VSAVATRAVAVLSDSPIDDRATVELVSQSAEERHRRRTNHNFRRGHRRRDALERVVHHVCDEGQ
jgi:hypothetical protein